MADLQLAMGLASPQEKAVSWEEVTVSPALPEERPQLKRQPQLQQAQALELAQVHLPVLLVLALAQLVQLPLAQVRAQVALLELVVVWKRVVEAQDELVEQEVLADRPEPPQPAP